MLKRRSKLEVIMDIMFLIQSKGGVAKPTHILYGANLSHSILKENLDLLLANEFIEKIDEDGRILYKLPEKV